MFIVPDFSAVWAVLVSVYEILVFVLQILQVVLLLLFGISGLLIIIFTYLVPGPEPERTLQKIHDKLGSMIGKITIKSKK